MRFSTPGRVASLAGLCALAMALGCSSGGDKLAGPSAGHGTATTGTATGAGGAGGAAGPGGQGGAPGPCAAPGYGGGEKKQMVESADVDVVDGEGALLTNYFVTLCGLDLCINGTTGADGHARIELFNTMKKPAIKLGDGAVHVKMAVPAPPSEVITFTQPIWLPALPKQGARLSAGQAATSGGVSVTLATEAIIGFDVGHYPTADLQALRAVELPVERSTALIAGMGLEILYGVGPTDTTLCPPAAVSVPNSLGWAAEQDVDFYLHGVDTEQAWAPYAGWAKVSAGRVSADGKAIETLPGEGLSVLGVLGIKRR